MRIRPMMAHDEAYVREIYAICHPGGPVRPQYWYFVHPTLVAVEGVKVLGSTSFVINEVGFDGTVVEQGCDVCVLPEHQGRGIGRELHEARIAVGRASGATMFCGTAAPDNEPMLAIFRSQGLTCFRTIQDANGKDLLAYVGPIGEK